MNNGFPNFVVNSQIHKGCERKRKDIIYNIINNNHNNKTINFYHLVSSLFCLQHFGRCAHWQVFLIELSSVHGTLNRTLYLIHGCRFF